MVFLTSNLLRLIGRTSIAKPSPAPLKYVLGGGSMPIPLASVLGTLGRFGLAGAGFTLGQRLLGGLFGDEEKKKRRRRRGIAVFDEEGNLIDVIPIKKKRPKRLPKYAYEAMKAQAELVKKMSEFMTFMMFKDMANHNNHD